MRAISFSLVLVLAVSLQIVAGDTSSAFTQLMADMIKDEYDDDAGGGNFFYFKYSLLYYSKCRPITATLRPVRFSNGPVQAAA